jgi:hypothetical protein
LLRNQHFNLCDRELRFRNFSANYVESYILETNDVVLSTGIHRVGVPGVNPICSHEFLNPRRVLNVVQTVASEPMRGKGCPPRASSFGVPVFEDAESELQSVNSLAVSL